MNGCLQSRKIERDVPTVSALRDVSPKRLVAYRAVFRCGKRRTEKKIENENRTGFTHDTTSIDLCRAIFRSLSGSIRSAGNKLFASRVPAGKSGEPSRRNIAQCIFQTVFHFKVANQAVQIVGMHSQDARRIGIAALRLFHRVEN